MNYWQWYLVVGLGLSMLVLGILAKEIWTNLSKTRASAAPLKALASYSAIAFFTTILWPIIVPLVVREKWSSRNIKKRSGSEERRFAPIQTDLIRSFALAEIELRELVQDPHGGAPILPFGHLNEAWTNFLLSLPADAEIWSYAVVWKNRFGVAEQHEGYAAVASVGIGPFFETVNYRLADQA